MEVCFGLLGETGALEILWARQVDGRVEEALEIVHASAQAYD